MRTRQSVAVDAVRSMRWIFSVESYCRDFRRPMTEETWAAPIVVALNSTIGFASQTETTWGPTALETPP
jgi:hypothetical protein